MTNQKTQMQYTDVGSGFPILLIHGHPFNRTMWRPQIDSLRWKHRVIAPDLPGYGHSPRREEEVVTQEMLAAELNQLLSQLQIEKACVVGLSMGGQIAMELTRAFPERTKALVLAATSAQAETPAGVVDRDRIANRLLAEGMIPVGSEMLCKLIGPRSLWQRPQLAADVFEMIVQTDPLAAAATVRGRALRRDYRPTLERFRGPALMVVGTDDAYTPVEDAITIQSALKRCHLEVFEDVGHLPTLESEDRFNSCLHSFLDTMEEDK